jgi:hypothetical protein
MAKKMDWMLPVLGIAGLGAVAIIALPSLLGGKEPDDSPRTFGRKRHHGIKKGGIPDGSYGDLYRDVFEARPPVKRLPVVDVSDLIDRRGLADDDDAYIITDKDFKLFDINRRDLPGYKRRIKEPIMSKVVYGDKGDRPVIVPYYDGYSYYTSNKYVVDKEPELGRLNNENQSRSNDRSNSINLYAR